MRVSIFQYDVVWMDQEANLTLIEKTCQSITGQSDLLILPEMFNTGYTMNPSEVPHEWQELTINKLKSYASSYKLLIAGSIPFYKDGNYYNTFICVSETGILCSYDKIHLFKMAGEDKSYLSGTKATTFPYLGFEILPLICYDLRFPYISYFNTGANVLIYCANWPEARVGHWTALLKARAIENQCYVIGVNRTGSDNNGYQYPGKSIVINFNGEVLGEMSNTPGIMTLTLDILLLNNFRSKLPFLGDRVSFPLADSK